MCVANESVEKQLTHSHISWLLLGPKVAISNHIYRAVIIKLLKSSVEN